MADPMFIENLAGARPWYTVDPETPYLIKASASPEFGYVLLITDMEQTYFCAGDKNTIISEKNVKIYCLKLEQEYNKTIETENY